MSTKPIRVLLVEDNPGDARLIREMLAEAEAQDFSVEWVSRLADGLERLSQDQIDVVLLDLGLPDSQGLDTFIQAHNQAPQVPFVVLSGLADQTLALTAVRKGAQDYLFKDETDSNLLLRAIRYATERKQAEEALRQSEQNLRYLASRLLDALEMERQRIAHELHDDLGQSLLLLKMKLSGITRGLPPELMKTRSECLHSIDNVQDIIDSAHRLSQGLVPPTLNEIGLKEALKDLIDEFSRHHDIAGSLDIDEIKGLFSQDTELNIYRILQESLTNVGKYSQATQVSVSIKRKDRQVWFSVEDNGIGFEVDQILTRLGRKRGLGLTSMEERARMMGGTFHIWSKPKAGTKIHITIPFRR